MGDEMSFFRRNKHLPGIIVVVLAVFIVLQLVDNRFSLIRGGDSISYLSLAKSIASGQGYSDIATPGHPPHTQYPPLLPLLLSPVFYFFGFNFFWMRLIIIAFAIASVWIIKSYFEKKSDNLTGTLIALAVATNFSFIFFARELMTEVPYIFLSFLALSLFERYPSDKGRPAFFIPAVIAITAAYFMRMIGITILLSALAVLLLRLKESHGNEGLKRLIYFAIAGALPFILWSVRGSLFSEGVGTYNSIFMQADYYSLDKGGLGFSALAERVFTNTGYIIESMPRVVMTWFGVVLMKWPQAISKIFNFIFFVLFAFGLLRELYLKRSASEFYVLFYLGLLAIWPVYGAGDAARYIVPILPFIYLYIASSVKSIGCFIVSSRSFEKKDYVIAAVFPFFILVNAVEIKDRLNPVSALINLSRSFEIASKNFNTRMDELTPGAMAADYFARKAPCYGDYLNTVFLNKDALKGGITVTRKPELVSLITGGHAVRYPYTKDMEEMERFVERNRADYFVVEKCYDENKLYLIPYIDSKSGDMERLFESPVGAVVMEYKKEG